MFNIERELEFVGSPGYEVRGVTIEGSFLRATIFRNGRHYDDWYFNRDTGVYNSHEKKDNGAWRLRAKSEMRPIDHFFLHAGERDWAKDQWVKLLNEKHPSGADAATRMKEQNAKATQAESAFRFIVKKETELSEVKDYAQWAAERFQTGEWSQVPWSNEEWARQHAHHFAHRSVADETQVAFWMSEADAQRDKITVMAPGRYLQTYFSDHLSPNDIRDWAVKHDGESELVIHTTADEMVKAYVRNAQGCMRYDDHSQCHDGVIWRSGLSPVRVYAAGDLAVATLERNGKAIGRALVWPAKKAVGRIYGDIERMKLAFEADGWEFDAETHGMESRGKGLLNGARILRMVPADWPNNTAMPYLDYGYKVIDKPGEEFMSLHLNGSVQSSRTDGLLYPPTLGRPVEEAPRRTLSCGCCYNTDDPDEICDPDDEDESDPCEDGSCDCCRSCDRCEQTVPHDETSYISSIQQIYCEDCTSAHTTSCDRCDERELDRHITSMSGGADWCRHCVNNYSTSCDYCSDSIPDNEVITVHDARDSSGHGDACQGCIDNDDRLVRDVNDLWVDTETAEQCGAGHWHGNDVDACPHPTCVTANVNPELELEPAE